MNSQAIYKKYLTPRNLQLHMLRVASLAKMIVDNWIGQKINDESVITCALFHDIAKPVTFDIDKQREYVSTEEEFNKVKQAINYLVDKYGSEEHAAAIKIFTEIGTSEEAIRLINNLEWIYTPRLLEEQDIPALLLNYCDMRIGTKGVLPIKQRFADLKERAPFIGIDEIASLSPKLESVIQSLTTIDLNSITDEQINRQMKQLG